MSFCQSCGTALPDGTAVCMACAGQTQAAGTVMAMSTPASTGMQPNAAGALAYLGGIITGAIFLVIDPFKSDRFVRFHSFQSIFFNIAWIGLWVAWAIIGFVLGAITKGIFFLIAMPINLLLMVGGFCL